MEINVEKVKLR